MTDLQEFVGTWRSERGAPYATMTFTWVATEAGLQGEWIIEAAAQPPGAAPLQMQVGVPTLDDARLLFTINDGPYITEFRLLGDGEAAVGAAPDKIPPEFSGPDFQRSIEGHRVRLRKVRTDAAV